MPDHLELSTDPELAAQRVYRYFGITKDPWDVLIPDTEDFKACRQAVHDALTYNHILVVVGDVGAGKTTFVVLMESNKSIHWITVDKENNETVSPQQILKSLIRGLRYDNRTGRIPADPTLQTIEAKELLIKRMQSGQRVVLCLDDGQQFQAKALRSLKRIREYRYGTKRHLLSIVYLTHTSGHHRLRQLEEIGRRSAVIEMRGLTDDETRTYVEKTVGANFEPEAVEAFIKHSGDRRPLVIQNQLVMLLNRAMLRGSKQVGIEDIEGGLSLDALIKRHRIKLAEIVEASGFKKSTVSGIAHGTYKGRADTKEKVRETVMAIVNKREAAQ
ncbi:MAG TPA: AAA family ATPase [Alphaproteobacteria bacterium]|nr:AAA family ATPase [Alphaproteobacteria bacterium]